MPNLFIKRDWRKRALNKQLLITRVEPPLSPAHYLKRYAFTAYPWQLATE